MDILRAITLFQYNSNMARPKRQVNEEEQKNLDAVVENTPTEVMLRNRKVKIYWLRRETMRRMSHIMLSDGDESKVSCKCAAMILLNGYWKIKMFYWLLWRWMYYVRQYYDKELEPIISEGKKKVPLEGYLTATILLTGMKDTMMTMTRKEVERIRQELSSVQSLQ